LPRDAKNRLHLPDFDAMSPEDNDRVARELLAQANYFGAHEAWETAWKQSKGTGDEEFYKGLSQMGAGYVHLLRGNAHGCVTLWRRAARRVGAYPDGHGGVATTALAERLEHDAKLVESGDLVPGPAATVEPPAV
jgi:hypothetical protein